MREATIKTTPSAQRLKVKSAKPNAGTLLVETISVDQDGKYFLTLGATKREPIDADTLVKKISAFVRENPQLPVLVAGDQRADYGKIYQAMVLLQTAGVPKVGLMSQPVQANGAR